jgi:FlaA1/EpsC-like NDP-sugar epimerase
MTIQEASQLVIQAAGMSSGSDIFLLDMGKPIRILDLAERMINLSGMEVKNNANPEGDIEIIFTGLKPGEKLYEELLIEDKSIQTQHEKIFKSVERKFKWEDTKRILDKIALAASREDLVSLNKIFANSVEGYKENTN